MNNFTFYTPTKIFFGKGEHRRVGEIIKNYGFHKILLHFGGGSIKKNGLYQEVTESLQQAGISFVPFGGVEPNPKLSLVKKGIELCRRESIEMILANSSLFHFSPSNWKNCPEPSACTLSAIPRHMIMPRNSIFTHFEICFFTLSFPLIFSAIITVQKSIWVTVYSVHSNTLRGSE